MRGHSDDQSKMFFYFSPEDRVPDDHSLRPIKRDVDAVLQALSPELGKLYSKTGRPSIPPERLLKASLLIALYSVRSDRQFCEQLDYNILFRWFLDMSLEEKTLDQSNFSRLRERLLDTDIAKRFFQEVVGLADKRGLLSSDHFTVDGTLIEAWASHKSFRPKGDDGSPPDQGGDVNYRGEKRKNDTHQSTTDPDAKMMRKGKGKEAKLSFGGHALMENRNGMLVGLAITDATLTETEAAKSLVEERLSQGFHFKTLGGDKGYHCKDFVAFLRQHGIAPHIARIEGRKTPGLDRRTTRHEGYRISQIVRKRVEEIFGWGKQIGGLRKTRLRGTARNEIAGYLVGAAFNLMRMTRLTW
ncbi:MAG: IS5 family transposase [Planctomycetaceae bacterium]|nr:IS5 family transposase [Planctomycetaceae bacterium]